MSIMRWLILTSTTLLLSGCFISDKPLFSPADAEQPLADGTKLAAFALDSDGKRKEDGPQTVTLKHIENGYLVSPSDDEPFRVLFDDIGDRYFIGVASDEDPTKSPLYGLFHQTGTSWFAYLPVCSDFRDLAKAQGKSLKDFHIADAESDCRFTSYEDLKSALMFLAAHGKPSTEYVTVD